MGVNPLREDRQIVMFGRFSGRLEDVAECESCARRGSLPERINASVGLRSVVCRILYRPPSSDR